MLPIKNQSASCGIHAVEIAQEQYSWIQTARLQLRFLVLIKQTDVGP